VHQEVPLTMTTVAESPESETHSAYDDDSKTNNPQIFNQTTPFIDYAAAQAQLYHRAFNDRVDSTIDAAKSRFAQIRSTSYVHFNQTLVKSLSLSLSLSRGKIHKENDLCINLIRQCIIG